MLSAEECYTIFQKSIDDYHRQDDVDTAANNPFPHNSFQFLLYLKNWIDTVQWHLEDLIRNPDINPTDALSLKRRIDKSNQDRTDTVEKIDDFFLESFSDVRYKSGTPINSETPAWLLDRMSILMLKIFHMREQTERKDVTAQHLAKCREKLLILEEQKNDMAIAFDGLLRDIGSGARRFKVYRQMKMYNDSTLNPVLYKGNRDKH
jgi:hypothetical protein